MSEIITENTQKLRDKIKDLQEQLEQKDKEIEALKAEVMVHAGDSSECSIAYGKLKARNEKLEKVVSYLHKVDAERPLYMITNYGALDVALNQLNEGQRIKESGYE